MQAGQSGCIQQRREAPFRISRLQRYAIQQQLVVGNAQQKARVSGRRQTLLQLVPGNFELRLRALVPIAIHPRVLNEDVQTVHKRPRRCGTRSLRCIGHGDSQLLEIAGLNLKVKAKR